MLKISLITKGIAPFLIIIFSGLTVSAQEVMSPVAGVPVSVSITKELRKSAAAGNLDLPFFDDFANQTGAPNPWYWADDHVYINNTYVSHPITAGVATFDAYTRTGAHYPAAGSTPYVADFLSSNPIQLNYPASDSLYLSFYYLSKGLGEMPDKTDSLCLAFFSPSTAKWTTVWHVPGDTMETFRQVMIPIRDEQFLEDGFRFRFYNYASESANEDYPDKYSNVDHWHIDYIYLNAGRTINDTIHRDVAFTFPGTSFLKDYRSIPWKHWESAFFTQRTASIDVEISNLDTAVRNTTRILRITNLYHPNTYTTTPTANDLAASSLTDHAFDYDYPFSFNQGDSALFEISAFLRTDAFDPKSNDTLTYVQEMNNYYAYDDGSVEAGYGLRGQGMQNASVAVRFDAFQEDTLRAIDMYFNQVVDSLNLDYYFYLKIWNEEDDEPGDELYSMLGQRPVYSTLNTPVRYYLDTALAVSGTFYIGWTKTVDKILNLGMDLNTNNLDNNLYTLGGSWTNSIYKAALMIRPVLSPYNLLSHSESTVKVRESNLNIYPNPANDYLYLHTDDPDVAPLNVSFFDLSGRMVLEQQLRIDERLYVGALKNGLYLLRCKHGSTKAYTTQKVIIQH